MTIDEAIIQFKEDAEYNRADLDLEWAEENEQVARWLEELKIYKESNISIKNYQQGRSDAINEVSRAMYHQCFECNNDEDMQRWDSGNWIRYRLFQDVIDQLKEQL